MGKLFGGKEKDNKADPVAAAAAAANLNAFLHTSTDNLAVTHPPPPPPQTSAPKLAKLDTSLSSRYPQALALNQQAQGNRPIAPGRAEPGTPRRSPRPNKKGTTVHFADTPPEVIGEGGDESGVPTAEISKRRPQKPKVLPSRPKPIQPTDPPPPSQSAPSSRPYPDDDDDFVPKPLSRTQTGYSSIYEPGDVPGLPPVPPPAIPKAYADEYAAASPQIGTPPAPPVGSSNLGAPGRLDDKRRSFIEIQGAQMREAEGQAFAKALRAASATSAVSEHNWDDLEQPTSVSPPDSIKSPTAMSPELPPGSKDILYSPAGSLHSASTGANLSPTKDFRNNFMARQDGITSRTGPLSPMPQQIIPTSATSATSSRLQDAVGQGTDDAFELFVARTKHTFELFRLHAETIKPLSTCSLKLCARGALWWFLKGRMGLESVIRDRPESPQQQMQNEVGRQQAYSNLAKAYWLLEEAAPEIADSQNLPTDPEVVEVEQALISALHKLSMSMQRNGFLPPEESFLPQQVDKTIWVEYPPLSQDIMALLSGNWGSGITAMRQPMSTLRLLDALPIGDSTENFNYSRAMADVYLMEQGGSGESHHFPCVLSTVRPASQTSLAFVIASQDGSLQLAIQDTSNAGPTWDNVRWKGDTCSLEIKLPRGFMLAVQLSQQDFRLLWNMYDFGSKLRMTMNPRPDEHLVFRNTLRSFQYMDADPKSRSFPKEPVPLCDVALFEKVYKEHNPAGPRNWHRGFRVAVITGPRTRTLSGVQHIYPPTFPIQFGFFRAEGDAPALSIKYENGRQRGRMVLVFNDDKERIKFHCTLTGTNLDSDDKIFADVPLVKFLVSQSLREPVGIAPFYRMPWSAARVVNDELGNAGADIPQTILSDKLRVCLEYANGTITDRVNVAPGELRVRLEVMNPKVFRVLRQPQQDFTMSVSESQVPKELPRNMYDALQLLQNNQTIRSYEFPSLKALHDFQFAMTGFEVVFDAIAVTFAIARRRMVVPIHKKWEAGFTRIQVVKLEDKQVQLLAFFEDFTHGHCMNFVLKGTDTYEAINRGGKSGIKFDDCKFPLPRMPADKDADYDDMAFVCLDLPDLPGEHDDISIFFEKESGKCFNPFPYRLHI